MPNPPELAFKKVEVLFFILSSPEIISVYAPVVPVTPIVVVAPNDATSADAAVTVIPLLSSVILSASASALIAILSSVMNTPVLESLP